MISKYPRRRVVVTGTGVVASNGVGLQNFRSALKSGKSGIKFIEAMKQHNFACQIAGVPEVDEELALKTIPAKLLHQLTEAMAYAVMAAVECANQSGDPVNLHDKDASPVNWRTGAVLGSGLGGGLEILLDEVMPVLQAAPQAEPGRGASPLGSHMVSKVMASGVSAIVGKVLGLGGQVTTNSSACTTGTEAIFEGYKNIILGYSDSMYVGGTEGTHYSIYSGFDAMRHVLCSSYNDFPEKGSQPMGAGACGFVPAGGCGVLRLESLESALARGAPILCELVSAYCNSGGQRDGGSMTFPNPDGVQKCIQYVLQQSGIDPREISLVNGHLTSTMADPTEVGAWMRALGLSPAEFPLIQSTKSMIGHGLGSAGAIEAVAVVDQIANGYVHPSINCEELHPELTEFTARVPRALIEKPLNYVFKSSFGFGDVNGCLLFKRWDGDKENLFLGGK